MMITFNLDIDSAFLAVSAIRDSARELQLCGDAALAEIVENIASMIDAEIYVQSDWLCTSCDTVNQYDFVNCINCQTNK